MSAPMSLRNGMNRIAVCPGRSIDLQQCCSVLDALVEDIVDWDFPDGDVARALAIKVLPGTRPYLIVQYRDSMRSSRRFGDSSDRHGPYRNIITKVDTGVYTIRPTGPLGAIIARLKPEAVALLLGERLQCFADAKIDLGDVFGAREVERLEETVSRAPTSCGRACALAHFLCARSCRCDPDPVVCRAVACLRGNPSVQIRRLAAELDIGERCLLRRFQTVFGVGPKHFARLARIEKVLAERHRGSDWADVAYGCGFADQAHMISDFNAVLGAPPERALRPASTEQDHRLDDANGRPIAHDYFVW